MRADVLKEKNEMEKIWDYWNYNLKGKGCPPPSPYIMDWEQRSRNKDDNELWSRSWTIIFICIIVLLFELVGLYALYILNFLGYF